MNGPMHHNWTWNTGYSTRTQQAIIKEECCMYSIWMWNDPKRVYRDRCMHRYTTNNTSQQQWCYKLSHWSTPEGTQQQTVALWSQAALHRQWRTILKGKGETSHHQETYCNPTITQFTSCEHYKPPPLNSSNITKLLQHIWGTQQQIVPLWRPASLLSQWRTIHKGKGEASSRNMLQFVYNTAATNTHFCYPEVLITAKYIWQIVVTSPQLMNFGQHSNITRTAGTLS